jgi:RNA polymerase sigma-70 factor (ECF subfamily)
MKNKAFKKLLNENRQVISKICNAYANNEEEFEDYFQEVALQIWKSCDSFEGKSKISTWIYRISLNVCLSEIRKKERRISTYSLKPELDSLKQEQKDNREQIKALYRAIRTLKKIDRAIIILYLEEKQYKEMADILGISVSNIGVKINRIKKELKEKLNG